MKATVSIQIHPSRRRQQQHRRQTNTPIKKRYVTPSKHRDTDTYLYQQRKICTSIVSERYVPQLTAKDMHLYWEKKIRTSIESKRCVPLSKAKPPPLLIFLSIVIRTISFNNPDFRVVFFVVSVVDHPIVFCCCYHFCCCYFFFWFCFLGENYLKKIVLTSKDKDTDTYHTYLYR